MAEQEKQI